MATAVPETSDPTTIHNDTKEHHDGKEGRTVEEAPGRVELTEADGWHKLGYSFPRWRKWQILIVVFFIQISMNLNASMYANGVSKIHEKFHVSKQVARIPQMAFLVAYGFGCELWAPWSEEYGRWPIQQLSLGLVNLWQIPCRFFFCFFSEWLGVGLGN